MKNKKPFIQLFSTPYGKYFFDVNTDQVYGVNDEIYEALKDIISNPEIKIDPIICEKLDVMKSHGLLRADKPNKIEHHAMKYIEYYLNNKLEHIVLQVTQDCNYRCKYCVYSEENIEESRRHSKRKMTIEIAKKAVDFLHEHSSLTKHVYVSFYGGEPLLAFDLIKQIIKYARDKFKGKPISFNMTTNCSLITKEIMDFFYENDMAIMISLDGPKKHHDSNRVFAVNGCGTFDIVMQKLNFIRENYPDYYRNKVNFSAVIDPSRDYDCVNEMYLNSNMFENMSAIGAIRDDSYSLEKNQYSEQFIQQNRYEEFKKILYEIGRIKQGSLSIITIHELSMDQSTRISFGKRRVSEEMGHGGPCIIGGRRIFCDTDGNLVPCEKVNEQVEVMRIGHVDTGIDVQKVKDLLDIGKLTEKECKNCWAINHCYLCAKFVEDKGTLSREKKLQYCNSVREKLEYDLQTYIVIKQIKTGGIQ